MKLGNKVQEFYQGTFGKVATVGILTYLHRELAHAIWRLLFDDDLMLYSTNGKAIKCFNKIMRAMLAEFANTTRMLGLGQRRTTTAVWGLREI